TGDEEGPLQRALQAPQPLEPPTRLQQLKQIFGPKNVFIEIQRHHHRGENRCVQALVELAEQANLPLLATNSVRYATPAARPALDVFTCMRQHTHLDAAGKLLSWNSECHLKESRSMEQLFRDLPEAIQNTERLAERLQFSLTDLGYEFPVYPLEPGESMDSCLRQQTYRGARERYSIISPKVEQQIEYELGLISRLGFAGYFL